MSTTSPYKEVGLSGVARPARAAEPKRRAMGGGVKMRHKWDCTYARCQRCGKPKSLVENKKCRAKQS